MWHVPLWVFSFKFWCRFNVRNLHNSHEKFLLSTRKNMKFISWTCVSTIQYRSEWNSIASLMKLHLTNCLRSSANNWKFNTIYTLWKYNQRKFSECVTFFFRTKTHTKEEKIFVTNFSWMKNSNYIWAVKIFQLSKISPHWLIRLKFFRIMRGEREREIKRQW